jgi:hypothetical protein
MIYPDMTNKLGKEARDHALHEHTVMKKVLVELDGMNLGHSDGSLNTKYVDLMRNLKKVRDNGRKAHVVKCGCMWCVPPLSPPSVVHR